MTTIWYDRETTKNITMLLAPFKDKQYATEIEQNALNCPFIHFVQSAQRN